jgi:glycosyltransferase involved in cell wall biosynthesis/ubiquinone/menaquinone biosynthesis C-methylase UbiE/uncharacterized protein YbaR (Trm112 family)
LTEPRAGARGSATTTTRRVLYVIHFPVFGGPHNQAAVLAAPLRAHGWDTVVLLPDEPGNAAERLREAGVDVITMPLHRLRATPNPLVQMRFFFGLFPEIRGIRHIIRDARIDLVQIGGLINPHAAIAARMEKVPIIWQLLDTRTPKLVSTVAMALVRRLADVVMSTGRLVAAAHPMSVSVQDRLVPYFPPVDVDVFRPRPDERAATRAEWGVPVDAPVVGCVANINPQKGIVDLVRAFVGVRDRLPEARLVLVGAEYPTHRAYSGKVREAMAEGGLREGRDVIFLGSRLDPQVPMAAFDVFAFAPVPRGEGITTAVLEAMACGLPVVTTAVAGLPEAIDDRVTGRLVDPLDPPELARVIVQLLEDRDTAARIGAAARARAVNSFTIDRCVDTHLEAYDRALTRHRRPPVHRTVLDPVDLGTVCPVCQEALVSGQDALICSSCGRTYPIVEGIPVLVPDLELTEHDEIDHAHSADQRGPRPGSHKASQADHFDRAVAEEFEITRPHGTPRLYEFLLREKFRRATLPIGRELDGASALTVCGGSGMDAEFLARAGARVVASDISLGAARRTRERARRNGLDITSIVADIEHLPFADHSVDVVFVHDGLHHLERPAIGLAEMGRVARRWVSVSEPARAASTAVAIRAGLALEREEAGNVVARLTATEVLKVLRPAGFRPLAAQRYAMYYRHEPGSAFRALSRRWIFPLVRSGWTVGNAIIGRAGNKLVVVATRDPK